MEEIRTLIDSGEVEVDCMGRNMRNISGMIVISILTGFGYHRCKDSSKSVNAHLRIAHYTYNYFSQMKNPK